MAEDTEWRDLFHALHSPSAVKSNRFIILKWHAVTVYKWFLSLRGMCWICGCLKQGNWRMCYVRHVHVRLFWRVCPVAHCALIHADWSFVFLSVWIVLNAGLHTAHPHTHTHTRTHTHTHTHSVWEPAAIATTPQTFQGQSCGEWNTHALPRLADWLQFCGCDWLPALFLPSSCPPLVSCHRVSGEELYPVAAAPALSPSSVAVRACERERVSQ